MTDLAGWREAAVTLAIGASGAALFWLIGFPMPFLTGPAAAVSAAALAGLRVGMPVPLRDACFLAIGLNIGASVTPEVLATAAQWPVSILLLTVLLILTLWLGRLLLERGFGFDRTSALLAATPGHLSYIISITAERDLPMARVALVQSVRVLLLTILVPVPLVLIGGGGPAPFATGAPMPLAVVGLLLALSFVVGLAFRRLRVPAPLLLAAMAVSGIGHGSGITPGAPPAWLAQGAFVVMGSLIGTRFRGFGLDELRRYGAAGLAVTALGTAIALAGALALGLASGIDPMLLFVAYAPGGVEAMAAISVQLGLAAAVVAAHHVIRLLILTVLVPVFLARLQPRV